MLTVRLDEATVAKLEAVRDPERFPTQSDFIREAIRRMVREERRDRVREQAKALSRDSEDVEASRERANLGWNDFVERWEKADRGEL